MGAYLEHFVALLGAGCLVGGGLALVYGGDGSFLVLMGLGFLGAVAWEWWKRGGNN